MIINCSMRHSTSGRKRKTNAYKKAKKPAFVAQSPKNYKKAETQDFPSVLSTKTNSCETIDNSWKVEESKKFTVAPAYNKGAYQVIPRGDVEWIGK
jgi:hypothetical protein